MSMPELWTNPIAVVCLGVILVGFVIMLSRIANKK